MTVAPGAHDTGTSPRKPAAAGAMPLPAKPALAAAAAVAAPTLYLAFNAGGFFVFATAVVALSLVVGLLLRVTLADAPFAGIGRAAALAIAAMALLGGWTLSSSLWSDAPARAMIEFDRALLYAAALALFACFPRRPGLLRALCGGLTVAIAAIAVAALATRLFPSVFPIADNVAPDRLAFPLTYWNALGLLAGAGIVAALHFSSDDRERRITRALACALLPVLAATVYFTLSRGAMAATAVGLVLYLTLARPRGALPTLLAAALPVAAVVAVGYEASALTSDDPTTAQAVTEGRRVALAILAAALVAGVLRAALAPLERRLPPTGAPIPRRALLGLGVAALVVAVALVAAGVPQRAVSEFANANALVVDDERSRLLSASNNGRIEHWRVALEAFASEPLLGTGAGTYQNEWLRGRKDSFTVINAHSLYAQMAGELGIVGLALLLAALGAIVAGITRRLAGPERPLAAAVLALTVVWALHAGIDWDWEMPAVTWWVFALGGAALAVAPGGGGGAWPRGGTRRLVLGLCALLVAVTPLLLGLSQRHLDRAARAFERGDCKVTIDQGLKAISVLDIRPQPYALVGVCDMRLGEHALAVRMLQAAVARDPESWEYRYALALALAVAGMDPMAEARLAHRLNRHERIARELVESFEDATPRQRRAEALRAPLPF